MSIKQKTDAEANQLATGVTDPATGVPYPLANADPYLAEVGRRDARIAAVLALAANLRVDEINEAADGVAVAPGRATIGGTVVVYAGADPAVSALPDNATTNVWLDAGGVVGSGAEWPAAQHLKLAEVVMASGAITAITDRRVDAIFTS